MIIPDGAVLKLDPRDEWPHVPEPARNYNESVYLDGFDQASRLGFWLRLGNRPHEGYAELSCCVYLPDGRIGFWFARPAISGNDAMQAGGMCHTMIEPFRHLTATYDGELLLLEDPRAMASPGQAFKTAPRVPTRLSFDVRGISPMHGGEIVNPDGSAFALDPESTAYRGHTEQHVSVDGEIRIGATTMPIRGFGTRDKSWGPRHWQNLFWHKWTPVTFGSDFGIVMVILGRHGRSPVVSGHVFSDGRLDPLVEAQLDIVYDEDHYQGVFEARLRTASRALLLRGEPITAIPLRHRRSLPSGSETVLRIIKAITRYECEGRTAFGMSEFLDVIEDGVPISRKDPLATGPVRAHEG